MPKYSADRYPLLQPVATEIWVQAIGTFVFGTCMCALSFCSCRAWTLWVDWIPIGWPIWTLNGWSSFSAKARSAGVQLGELMLVIWENLHGVCVFFLQPTSIVWKCRANTFNTSSIISNVPSRCLLVCICVCVCLGEKSFLCHWLSHSQCIYGTFRMEKWHQKSGMFHFQGASLQLK